MRARTEVVIALGAAAALIVLAFATGSRLRGGDDPDMRPSSFGAGRQGVRALADAAERLGVTVERWRERPQRFAERTSKARPTRPLRFAVLSPGQDVTAAERGEVVRLALQRPGADLILAGEGAESVMQCFGVGITASVFDSSRVAPPGAVVDSGAAWTHASLSARPDSAGKDEDEIDGEPCPAVTILASDTLLVTRRGAPVIVQLTVAPHRHLVTLVADVALLRNRTLRSASTAPLLLDAVLPRAGGRLVFDEYHHGFGPGGSMMRVTLDWSARHPLGWMTWQLIVVGLVALLVGGIRFGPIRAAIVRQRRSPLEHVRALATALSAARGHREAVGAMVRGLRRRLAAHSGGATARDDWRAWLTALVARAPNAKVRANAERLVALANDSQPDTAVLDAANAVEDLWLSLRP